MDIFGLVFFVLFAWACAVFGAGYYHFVSGVGKTKQELAEAKEKIATLEKHSATTQQMLPLKRAE
jgi:hypothetical protein